MLQRGHEPEAAHRRVLTALRKAVEAAVVEKVQNVTMSSISFKGNIPGCSDTQIERQDKISREPSRQQNEMAHSLSVTVQNRLHKDRRDKAKDVMKCFAHPTFLSRSIREKPEQQAVDQQKQLPQVLPSGTRRTPDSKETASNCFQPQGTVLKLRSLPKWAFANCTPVDVRCPSALGNGQALCSDASGALVLVALENCDLCLLQISVSQGSAELTDAAEGKPSEHKAPHTCTELLTITEALHFTNRPQGEAAMVQVGGETILLMGEPQNPDARRPERLVVLQLSNAKRRLANGASNLLVEDDEELPQSVPFSELPMWQPSHMEVSPKTRSFYSVSADDKRQAIVLFGGTSPTRVESGLETCVGGKGTPFPQLSWHPRDDLWSFSMCSCKWVQHFRKQRLPVTRATSGDGANEEKEPSSPWPPAVAGHSVATWERNMWVFGGYTEPCVDTGAAPRGAAVSDFWCLSLDDCTWRQVHSSGKAPPARYCHASCIVGGSLLVFGGIVPEGLVSAVDTLYAADITGQLATWTRVTILDDLPRATSYMGAALPHGPHTSTDMGAFLVYGGCKAFIITARNLKKKALEYPIEDLMQQRQPSDVERMCAHGAPEPVIPEIRKQKSVFHQRTAAGQLHREYHPCPPRTSPAKVAWVDTEECTKEDGSQLHSVHWGTPWEQTNCNQTGVKKSEGHSGLQIFSTPMPGSRQHTPDIGTGMSASTKGILPQVQNPIPESLDSEKSQVWQTTFSMQQAIPPIVFRARCRGRRRNSQESREESENPQGHPVGPQLSNHTDCSTKNQPPQGFKNKPATSQPGLTPQGSSSRTTAPITGPTTTEKQGSLHNQTQPLSHQQRSILLSLSHRATVGSASNRGGTGVFSGTWTGESSFVETTHGCARPAKLVDSRMTMPAVVPIPMPLGQPISSGASYHPRKDPQSCAVSPNSLKHCAQPINLDIFGIGLETSSQDKSEKTRLAIREGSGISAGEAAEKAHPQHCRLGSLASKQPAIPPASFSPLAYAASGSPKKGVEGVDALRWWVASTARAQQGISAKNKTRGNSRNNNRSHSCFSSRPAKDNSGSTKSSSAWPTGANSRYTTSSDAAFIAGYPSPRTPPSRAACWLDSSQKTARFLTGIVYSSQSPGVPAQYSATGRKMLHLRPCHLDPTEVIGSGVRSKLASRVAPLAFTTESVGGHADGGLPFPRSARRIKESTKVRQRSCSIKPKGRAGGPAKTKLMEPHSTKPTPRQMQKGQRPILHLAYTPTPSSGRNRSIPRENTAALYDRALGNNSNLRFSRDTRARSVGSGVRKMSTKSQSGRKAHLRTIVPSSAVDVRQSSDERLLRRMLGWPGEAIANLFMASTEIGTDPLQPLRTSSMKTKRLQKK